MIYITRKEHFNAAHRLFNPDWDDQKNQTIFGKCSNPNWHGHNYTLYVTVKGEIDTETGFVMNLKDLSQIVNDFVIDKVDHKNLNIEVDFLKDKRISAEVITQSIWEQLEVPIQNAGGILHCVRLHETENNYVEYFGKH